MNGKSTSWKVTTLVILILLVLIVAFGVYEIIQGERISKDRGAAEREAISKLVNRYNAITDWKVSLEQLDEPYVADVQEALIRKDGRPILLSAEVTDIVKREDKNVVHFRETNSDDPDVHYTLECSPEQIKTITEHQDEFTEFTVVASITSVRRANKEDVREDSDPLDTFVATGRCSDLQYFDVRTSRCFTICLSIAFILLLAIFLNRLMSH